MLVASEMMNINESPSTLKEISVRKALNFTKNVLYQLDHTNVSFCEFKGKITFVFFKSKFCKSL